MLAAVPCRPREVDSRERVSTVAAAHDGVCQQGPDHRYDDADDDLGDPILHASKMLEMGGKI